MKPEKNLQASVSHQLFLAAEVALRAHCPGYRLNISALARAIDEPTTKLWGYATGKIRWPADVWLKAMAALRALTPGADWIRLGLDQVDEQTCADLIVCSPSRVDDLFFGGAAGRDRVKNAGGR